MAVRDEPVKVGWVDAIDADDIDSAASLYLRAKRDANDRSLGIGQRQEARRVMGDVVRRFPGVAEHAAEAADHELGIDGNPDLKRTRDAHRSERGVSARDAAHARRRRGSPSSTGRPAGGPQGARKAPPKPRPRTTRRPWSGRYAEQTGIPGAGRSATAFALQLFGVMVGLSLTFLLLRNAELGSGGWRFLEQGLGSVTTGLQRFVAPVDPLAKK